MAKNKKPLKDNIEIEENKNEEVVEIEEKETFGYVTGCYSLRIRKEPSVEADIICELPANTKLSLGKQITRMNKFYRVALIGNGIEGWAMDDYIAVK